MTKTRMGRVKRAVVAAFEAQPRRWFTTAQLAAIAYPGLVIEKRHLDATDRAIRSVAPTLGLVRCRVGTPKTGGWHNSWGAR